MAEVEAAHDAFVSTLNSHRTVIEAVMPSQQSTLTVQMSVLDDEFLEILRELHSEGCGSSAEDTFEQASQLLDRLEAIETELKSLSLVAEELLHCRHLCGEEATKCAAAGPAAGPAALAPSCRRHRRR